MKLSIVIPCYNEEKTIREVLKRVEAVILPPIFTREIIIVDDHSNDSTRNILRELEKQHRVIYKEKNEGKGAAMREGVKNVSGDFVVFQDADIELDPNDYNKLLEPLMAGKADMALGSRFLLMSKSWLFGYYKYYLANKIINWVFNLLFFSKFSDVNCGYKMFTTRAIKSIDLVSNSFEVEVEIMSKMKKGGWQIKEVPVSYLPRNRKQGKKIRLKHALAMIFAIVKHKVKKNEIEK